MCVKNLLNLSVWEWIYTQTNQTAVVNTDFNLSDIVNLKVGVGVGWGGGSCVTISQHHVLYNSIIFNITSQMKSVMLATLMEHRAKFS